MAATRKKSRLLIGSRWTPAELRGIPASLGYVAVAEGQITITREEPAGPAKRSWTDAELMALPDDDKRYELIDGELIMSPPPGFPHGALVLEIARHLGNAIQPQKLGKLTSQSGYRIGPKDCYAPDIAFVLRKHLPLQTSRRKPYPRRAPDLAVEVISPSNRLNMIKKKIATYFSSGTALAWLVLPEKKEIHVYTAAESFKVLTVRDTLTAAPLIPNFKLRLSELFADDMD